MMGDGIGGGGSFITGCGMGGAGVGHYLVVLLFFFFTCTVVLCSLMSSVPFFK